MGEREDKLSDAKKLKIGNQIYLPSSFEMNGGRATIKSILPNCYGVPFLSLKEVPGISFNADILLARQEELKKQFGTSAARVNYGKDHGEIAKQRVNESFISSIEALETLTDDLQIVSDLFSEVERSNVEAMNLLLRLLHKKVKKIKEIVNDQ